MFGRQICVTFAGLALGAAMLGISLVRIDSQSSDDYASYVSHEIPEPFACALAHRTGVSKCILHLDALDRSYRVDCDRSRLELTQEGEVLEHMEGVRGLIQEELSYHRTVDSPPAEQLEPSELAGPIQTVREFEARSALFAYRSQRLQAEQATLLRYEAPGHRLPHFSECTSPSVDGSADALVIQVGEEGKSLCHAKRFRATLYSLPKLPSLRV